jgi:hypothetical protein
METSAVPSNNRLWSHYDERTLPTGPEPSRQDPEEPIERGYSWPGTFPFQHHELLTTAQVFEKESATSADKPKNPTCQEPDGTYHARVLAHFPCGRQCRILLKSQADRILARGSPKGIVQVLVKLSNALRSS